MEYIIDDTFAIPDEIKNMTREELNIEIKRLEAEQLKRREPEKKKQSA